MKQETLQAWKKFLMGSFSAGVIFAIMFFVVAALLWQGKSNSEKIADKNCVAMNWEKFVVMQEASFQDAGKISQILESRMTAIFFDQIGGKLTFDSKGPLSGFALSALKKENEAFVILIEKSDKLIFSFEGRINVEAGFFSKFAFFRLEASQGQ